MIETQFWRSIQFSKFCLFWWSFEGAENSFAAQYVFSWGAVWSKCWKLWLLMLWAEDGLVRMGTSVGKNYKSLLCHSLRSPIVNHLSWKTLWHQVWSQLDAGPSYEMLFCSQGSNHYFQVSRGTWQVIHQQHMWDCFRLSGCLIVSVKEEGEMRVALNGTYLADDIDCLFSADTFSQLWLQSMRITALCVKQCE